MGLLAVKKLSAACCAVGFMCPIICRHRHPCARDQPLNYTTSFKAFSGQAELEDLMHLFQQVTLTH